MLITLLLMRYFAATLTICCLLFPLCAPAQSQGKPLLIVYPDYPPFFSQDDQGEMTGFFYEIVTEALARLGVEAKWESKPWARCQADVAGDDADAMITVPTQKRLAYCRTHPAPFYIKTMNVFTYAGHPRLDEMKAVRDLEDIKRGGFTLITYISNGWHKEHVTPLRIPTEESPCLKCVWKMLAYHRGDIIIEWPAASWTAIREQSLDEEIVDTGVTVGSMPFHLLVGKNSPYADVVDRFDEAIESMRADGTMAAILEKY